MACIFDHGENGSESEPIKTCCIVGSRLHYHSRARLQVVVLAAPTKFLPY